MRIKTLGQTSTARALLALACACLAACASTDPASRAQANVPPNAWAQPAAELGQGQGARWEHLLLPGKQPARFRYVRLDGREAMAATADSAASMLRRKVRVEPAGLGLLRFSWKVPELLAGADLGVREKADSSVRIILAFEGDRSRLSARDLLLSDLVQSMTGEPMPYATLMYVWCSKRPEGAVIRSPRTDRIRKLVVESGGTRLNQWIEYERDIRADFRRAFGEEPGALVGIAIMTDSDNTRSRASAWYGPLQLVSRAAP